MICKKVIFTGILSGYKGQSNYQDIRTDAGLSPVEIGVEKRYALEAWSRKLKEIVFNEVANNVVFLAS